MPSSFISHSKLGSNFLFPEDRRDGGERRREYDRRTRGDRRAKDVTQRLQTGFWQRYSVVKQVSRSDDIDLNSYELFEMMSAVKMEGKKYLCYDQHGTLYNMDDIINLFTYHIWSFFTEQNGQTSVKAHLLTDTLASKITTSYIIKCKDRRMHPDRRSGRDRRSTDAVNMAVAL